MGVTPDGWREAAGKFGDDEPRSVADINGPETLGKVREWKKAPEGRQAGQAGPSDADLTADAALVRRSQPVGCDERGDRQSNRRLIAGANDERRDRQSDRSLITTRGLARGRT